MAASQESIGALLKVDSLLSQAQGQPIVLVQAYPCGEGKVGTQAYKHPAPAFVVQVEIVLVNPALLEFQVRAVVLLSANRHQDPGWLPGLENHGHAIGRTASQILMYEVIAPPFLGRFHKGSTPFFRSVLQPVLELIGDFRQGPPGHSFSLSVGIKEPRARARVVGTAGSSRSAGFDRSIDTETGCYPGDA